jgi:2-C-methyl-D-erythritol 4-phosphate cytidylyltransferase/2-C-methyl-D-erythritol 2,4-cyclodiphosphate synthase
MSVGVIIVAAGRGARLGAPVPKQLLDVGGRSMLQRSVATFDVHPRVSELVVVLPEALVGDGPSLVGRTLRPLQFTAGGVRRQDSVREGFAKLSPGAEIVLVHDAARPFADAALIDRVIAGATETGAAVPAMRSRDTVKRVETASEIVRKTIPRDEIWLAQTPQGFRHAILREAIALGEQGVDATDEAMLVERAGHPVRVVTGDERNIKITTEDDLASARSAATPAPRVGTGYDLHRLVPGRPLVFAGVVVPFERGPQGHSDGDVLSHSVIDAMFGAVAAGDIGRHYSDSDPRWKDAAGCDLLRRATEVVGQLGWMVASVDATIILERPKLAPHIQAMCEGLAGALGIAVDQASIKAKTNEGVDAVGRGEAVAAQAVAVLVRRPLR